jgi:hypothetical protein
MAFPSSPVNNQTATVNGITYYYNSTKGAWIRSSVPTSGNISANVLTVNSTTDSISSSSGALIVSGGAGIGLSMVVGGNITAANVVANHYGNIMTAAQPNVTSLGNLTSLSASGPISSVGQIRANANIASTSASTGSFTTIGGVGITGDMSLFGIANISSASTNSSYISLTNFAANGRSYSIYSSGGGPATSGYFGIYDNTSGGNRLVLDNNGYLGVNTALPSTYNSMVTGYQNTNGLSSFCAVSGSSATSAIEIRDGAATPNRWWLMSGLNSVTDGVFSIYDKRQSVSRVAIDTIGNVGFGTLSPTANIDVQGNTAASMLSRIWNTNTTGTGSAIFRIANSGNNTLGCQLQFSDSLYYTGTITSDRTNGVVFYSGQQASATASERARLDINGNWGLGNVGGGYSRFECQVQSSGSQNAAWFKNFSGSTASPTESSDWPWPVVALTGYGNYYKQTMLSFSLPGDGHGQGGGVYHTDDSIWNISLNGVTGGASWDNNGNTVPSVTSSSSVGLQLLGPGNLRVGTSNSNNIYFRTNGSDRAYFNSSGHLVPSASATYDLGAAGVRWRNTYLTSLGVGTDASGTAGEIRATGAITANYSDNRLKNRIGKIENALDKIDQLTGFLYTPNELAAEFGFTDQTVQVGLSAQDVNNIQPEAVKPAPFDTTATGESISGENYLTVQYERLLPLIVEGIKELRLELKEIKTQVIKGK